MNATRFLAATLLAFWPAVAAADESARLPLLHFAEGSWQAFSGTLQVLRTSGDQAEGLKAGLEIGYLALGRVEAGDQSLLLVRSGESTEGEGATFNEAVSLTVSPSGETKTKFPLEDRAERVSPLGFSYLPLSIFPAIPNTEPREWTEKTRLSVLYHEPVQVELRHRVAPIAGAKDERFLYTRTALPGQKLALSANRIEVPFEIESLVETFTLRLEFGTAGRAAELLEFRSSLRGKLPTSEGPPAVVTREIELSRNAAQTVQGEKWERLKAEARRVEEIERALFLNLDADGAESRQRSFEKEFPAGRFVRAVAGLTRQAEDVAPIAQERKLYGKPAPDFTLEDLEGKSVTLSKAAQGKITLLTFWSIG